MAALNATGRVAPEPRDLTTFSGAPLPLSLDGPASIFRLLGTWKDLTTGQKARSNPFGAFWFSRSVIDVLREDFIDANYSGDARPPGQSLIRNVREGLAVSYEWNSFDTLIEMAIPAGASIEAWSGLTEWQLEYQSKPTGRLLSGGLVQYLVYDVARVPSAMLKQKPLGQLWAQFSRQMPARPL